jgi:hypothetical protein
MITETEKSHDLPSGSWKPRKGSGVVQSKSEGLRTRRADVVSVQGQNKNNDSAHQAGRKK